MSFFEELKLRNVFRVGIAYALAFFALDKFVWTDAMAPVVSTNDGPRSTAVLPYCRTAVLPFINMSSDQEQECFSDGLAEELLNLLARISELRVTSRSSSFSYKGKDFKIADVGRASGVGHVLEGSVHRSIHQAVTNCLGSNCQPVLSLVYLLNALK